VSDQKRIQEGPRRRRWHLATLLMLGGTSALALAAMVAKAVAMLRSGRGAETYITHWLVEFNWVGLLVFVAAAALAVCLGLVMRWLQQRREQQEWRELEKTQERSSAGA
jgi:uncharacterized membrane protein